MKRILDDAKRRDICTILSLGGTRTMAARFVGCHERTIRKNAQRDPSFREQLRKTELSPEITFLKSILDAAREKYSWQAARWALERMYPDRYAQRQPNTLTPEQVSALLEQVVEALGQAVPNQCDRLAIRRQLAQITRRAAPRTSNRRNATRSRLARRSL